jgi:hypothetical protein
MAERDVAQAQAQDQAFRAYVHEAAHGTSTADELAKLADLRDHGIITEADFQQGKDKILRGRRLTRTARDRCPSGMSLRKVKVADRPSNAATARCGPAT